MAVQFDWSRAKADCRGDEVLLRTRARDFIDHKDQLLDDLHRALHDENAEGVKHSAHALKEQLRLFGGHRLEGLCQHLEHMGEDGTFTGADETLMELSGAIHGVGKALEVELLVHS